jgi:ABC-type multidrug transport system fused ATPase/permease subunit
MFAWSRLWVKLVSALYGAAAMAFLVYAVHTGAVSTTLASVIMSALFGLTAAFSWLSWSTTYLGETLGNARRVYALVDLPPEESEERRETALQATPVRPPAPLAAPAGGAPAYPEDIVFADFAMAYRRGMPRVLNGLSLVVPAGKHVGIIGRTGAGKSSVMQSLLRMVYVEAGDVRVGSRSIYELAIDDLRQRFGVVPQQPYLFAGALRNNLDRFDAFDDAALSRALALVGLPLPLTMPLTEGGANLSVGERQLVCLARVLLTGKRYVLMDEPTSSIDVVSDARIQRLLAEHLAGLTVLTIAHRLDTLRGYDLVYELEAGVLKRSGPPSAFLST